MSSIFVPGVVPTHQATGAHPRVAFLTESSVRFELPLAPPLSRDGLAPRYTTLDRVGRKSLLTRSGYELRVYNVELLIVARGAGGGFDHQVSVEGQLDALRKIASSGERVRWDGYGPSEVGWYKITTLSEQDMRRKHGTNEITQAQISLTLTEVVDAVAHVGPVTGGVAPSAAAPAPAAPSAAAPGPKTYTVVKGDTLAGIAIKLWKDANRWKQLADANKITNPKAIKVGQVLTVP